MLAGNKRRYVFILFLMMLLVVASASQAFFSREYLFLSSNQGCYDSNKTVKFSFENLGGDTELDIPINYILNADNWKGVVHLWIEMGLDYEDLGAYCDKAVPLLKDGRKFYEPTFPKPIWIHVSRRTNGTITMEENIASQITGITSMQYIESRDGYSIFQRPSARKIDDEILVPNANDIGTPYYVECKGQEPGSSCTMKFHHNGRLMIEVILRRDKLPELKRIYVKVAALLDNFTTIQ